MGAKNHDTYNGTWLAHQTDATLAGLAKRTTDSMAISFLLVQTFLKFFQNLSFSPLALTFFYCNIAFRNHAFAITNPTHFYLSAISNTFNVEGCYLIACVEISDSNIVSNSNGI